MTTEPQPETLATEQTAEQTPIRYIGTCLEVVTKGDDRVEAAAA